MSSTLNINVLEAATLDGDCGLRSAVSQNRSMHKSHTTSLAKVAFEDVACIRWPSPSSHQWLQMFWQRQHALHGKDGRNSKRRCRLLLTFMTMANVDFQRLGVCSVEGNGATLTLNHGVGAHD